MASQEQPVTLTIQDAPLTDPSSATVPFFKRKSKGKPTIRKRPPTPPPAAADSEDDSEDASFENEDDTTRPIKRHKKGGISESSRTATSGTLALNDITPETFASSTALELISTNDATKQTAYHNESEAEYLARKNNPTSSLKSNPIDSTDMTTYRGSSNYTDFIKKPESRQKGGGGKGGSSFTGPIKAPSNIRTITVTDFAPDVCKDYKQTGFCGFGDSCKFLHAREDYAQGWELDKHWEIKKKNPNAKTNVKTLDTAFNPIREKNKDRNRNKEEEELQNIPFKCVICKEDYKSPVVTKCGHFFCERCALGRYREGRVSCAICGGRTDGVFNVAKGLQKKLDLKKEREEMRKKKEEEEEEARRNAGPIIQGGW